MNPLENNPRRAYEPLLTVVTAGAVGGAALFAWMAFERFGLTDSLVCTGPLPALRVPTEPGAYADMVRPGLWAGHAAAEVCQDGATLGQRMLAGISHASGLLFLTATLALVAWLLRRAVREGPYRPRNIGRLRFLGWWLLVAGSLSYFVGGWADASLAAGMVRPGYQESALEAGLTEVPPGLLLIALGLLTVARILRIGAAMRDELAGTV